MPKNCEKKLQSENEKKKQHKNIKHYKGKVNTEKVKTKN